MAKLGIDVFGCFVFLKYNIVWLLAVHHGQVTAETDQILTMFYWAQFKKIACFFACGKPAATCVCNYQLTYFDYSKCIF